jgi:hypothetical protein
MKRPPAVSAPAAAAPPPAAAPAPGAHAPTGGVGSGDKIGVDDVLGIAVWYNTTVSRTVPVVGAHRDLLIALLTRTGS